MEPNLTDNQILAEDGHGREDIVRDDLDRLVDFKQDFIDLMKSVKRHVSKEAFEEHAVAIEQAFDDMLHDDFEKLNASIDARLCLPESYELNRWNADTRAFKPLPVFTVISEDL